jgi:DNA-binding transcriptional LysR family regulator
MRLFSQLAESGTLTGTARVLGTSKQTVSRRLAELEQTLGVELARRTTRRVTLTDIGRAYAARCAEVVRLADEANRAVTSRLNEVRGMLRITADHTFGEAFVAELVTRYLRAHDGVRVEVLLTSRQVDLLGEGFDVAFRVGPAPDVTHLAATRLGPARLWTVACPDYLSGRPAPDHPDDLAAHDCVAAVPTMAQSAWPFDIDGSLRLVGVEARVRVNGLAMARRAALGGVGVAHLPEFAVSEDVAEGRLVRLLADHTPEVGGVNLVYPHSQLLAPKVTEFVALAVEHFASTMSLTPRSGRSRRR